MINTINPNTARAPVVSVWLYRDKDGSAWIVSLDGSSGQALEVFAENEKALAIARGKQESANRGIKLEIEDDDGGGDGASRSELEDESVGIEGRGSGRRYI